MLFPKCVVAISSSFASRWCRKFTVGNPPPSFHRLSAEALPQPGALQVTTRSRCGAKFATGQVTSGYSSGSTPESRRTSSAQRLVETLTHGSMLTAMLGMCQRYATETATPSWAMMMMFAQRRPYPASPSLPQWSLPTQGDEGDLVVRGSGGCPAHSRARPRESSGWASSYGRTSGGVDLPPAT